MFNEDGKALIAESAKYPLELLGCPFRRWLLEKLHQYLVAKKIICDNGIIVFEFELFMGVSILVVNAENTCRFTRIARSQHSR